jgi:hypothetical protein
MKKFYTIRLITNNICLFRERVVNFMLLSYQLIRLLFSVLKRQ